MKILNEHIKKKTFKAFYLVYGNESYLVKFYEERLKSAIVNEGAEMMNLDIFEGKNSEVKKIAEAAETMPFINDYRLVVIKNSGLFTTGRKNDTEDMSDYINELSTKNKDDFTTIFLFIEDSDNVDKRNRLFKTVVKEGYAAECKTPTESELVTWVCKLFKKDGFDISSADAVHFLRTVGDNMENVLSEVKKLVSYKAGDTAITAKDIDKICTKSLEGHVFDLMNAIGSKNVEKALEVYSHMLFMKESPIMVLVMMHRQFKLILQCGFLSARGIQQNEIADKVGVRSFTVKDYVTQSKKFHSTKLLSAMADCLKTDVDIKSGLVSDELGVELMIIKYCS